MFVRVAKASKWCFVLSPFMFQVYITVMDNNDNPPVFSQPTYEVTISEGIQPETEVIQVVASDRDEHHHLTYSLQSSIDPSSMRLFRIHPTLGIIYTTQMLDREACAQHILTVIVSPDHSHAQCLMFRILFFTFLHQVHVFTLSLLFCLSLFFRLVRVNSVNATFITFMLSHTWDGVLHRLPDREGYGHRGN